MEELFTIAVSLGEIVHNRGFTPVVAYPVFCQLSARGAPGGIFVFRVLGSYISSEAVVRTTGE